MGMTVFYATIDSPCIPAGIAGPSPARLSAVASAAGGPSAKPSAPRTSDAAVAGVTGAAGPRRPGYVRVKTGVEWLVALALFVLTGPLVAALAAAVKLTSAGPAF